MKNQNNYLSRLEHLLETTKPPSTPPLPRTTSSSSNFTTLTDKSFYEKYSKIWSNRSYPKSSLSFLLTVHKKLCQKYLSLAWRQLTKPIYDPLSFTLCSNCGNASLTILTSSTQDRLSPKFLSKVTSLLPKPKPRPKNLLEASPKIKRKNIGDGSIDQKIKISDLSAIAPNNYFLSSLSSPNLLGKKEEVSFDLSRDSVDLFNLPRSKTKTEGLKSLVKTMEILQGARLLWAFKEVSKAPVRFRSFKPVTSNRKTSFKILFSRLEKFLFRRKMQGFYSISEILYR